MDRDRDIARGAEPKDSFFAFGFWLLAFGFWFSRCIQIRSWTGWRRVSLQGKVSSENESAVSSENESEAVRADIWEGE
jgi:hypothetical protein